MKIPGISGAMGIGTGPIYYYKQEPLLFSEKKIDSEDTEKEIQKFDTALQETIQQLENIRLKMIQNFSDTEAEIFEAHIEIVKDPSLYTDIQTAICQELYNAASATRRIMKRYEKLFSAMENRYMQERAQDIRDISDRLIRNILHMAPRGLDHLTSPVIVVTHDLTPSDIAALDKTIIKGIVTAIGGPTSHTAIMARNLEIPTVMGIEDLKPFAKAKRAIVNGDEGFVILNPEDDEYNEHVQKEADFRAYLQSLKASATLPAITTDGHQISLFANIGKGADSSHACHLGAEGVGLFRTEFLYMENEDLPSEDLQVKSYIRAAERLRGNPVIIRTADIGGDKKVDSLSLPDEMNPFLGNRALRLSLVHKDMFMTQLRAILRASAFGDVRIMYPMITTLEEIHIAKSMLEEAKNQLRSEGIPFTENIKQGIMVEVPAVALMADLFAKEVDFFSIGTNDLCQYTLAVDRMNEQISYLYNPSHPAIIQLIHKTITEGHLTNIEVSICGEMAGMPLYTMLLIGLGLTEFSMTSASIPHIKEIIRHVSYAECKALADKIRTMTSSSQINTCLREQLHSISQRY